MLSMTVAAEENFQSFKIKLRRWLDEPLQCLWWHVMLSFTQSSVCLRHCACQPVIVLFILRPHCVSVALSYTHTHTGWRWVPACANLTLPTSVMQIRTLAEQTVPASRCVKERPLCLMAVMQVCTHSTGSSHQHHHCAVCSGDGSGRYLMKRMPRVCLQTGVGRYEMRPSSSSEAGGDYELKKDAWTGAPDITHTEALFKKSSHIIRDVDFARTATSK